MSAAPDYERRACLHRPSDLNQLDAEIRRLHANGLTAMDIAMALRLPPDVIINALGENQHADIAERRCMEPAT